MRRGGIRIGTIFMSTFWLLGMALQSDSLAADKQDLTDRVVRSKEVFQELITAEDHKVPQALLDKAKCVAVIPGVIKGAMGFGARHGRGVMTCKDADGRWSPPAFVTLSGGSFGLQFGVESTDLVLFFMSERGAKSLVNDNKITLGGKLGVAAGPIGRTGEAATDLELKAEIYSYAKSKGLFAGISLEGARFAPDNDANRMFYGSNASAKALLFEHQAPETPVAVNEFLLVLPK